MGHIHFKGKRDTVKVKVTAKLPLDMGKELKVPFICQYRVPDRPTAQQIIQDAVDGKVTDDELIRDWLTGWEKLPDENEEPIEYSHETLEEILTIAPYQAAIITGFLEVLYGKEALRQKNSSRLARSGLAR